MAFDDSTRRLIRAGAVTGIGLGVVQLAGIIMHDSIPPDAAEALTFIREHPVWTLTHILLIGSYFLVVSFYVGLRASFDRRGPMVAIAGNTALVGAVLGAVHFAIHLTIMQGLAVRAGTTQTAMSSAQMELLYRISHMYAHYLNRASGLSLMAVGVLFGIAMLRDGRYRAWLGWLGTTASAVTFLAIVIGELFLTTRTTDIVFAVALIPTIVWIVAVSIAMFGLIKREAAAIA